MGQDTSSNTTISFTEKTWVPRFYRNKVLCHSYVFCVASIFLDLAAVLAWLFTGGRWFVILFAIAFLLLVLSIPRRIDQPVQIILHGDYMEIYRENMYRGGEGCFDIYESFWYSNILFCVFDTGKCRLEFYGAYTEYWFRGDNQEPFLERLRDDCSLISLKYTNAGEICRQVEENSTLSIIISSN